MADIMADVTGLMVPPSDGWQERVAKLCKPEYFLVTVALKEELMQQLTPDELARLRRKMVLVQQCSAIMLAGMLKGTLKYPTDNYSVDQWVAHLVGEGADQMNYALLLADAHTKTVAKSE